MAISLLKTTGIFSHANYIDQRMNDKSLPAIPNEKQEKFTNCINIPVAIKAQLIEMVLPDQLNDDVGQQAAQGHAEQPAEEETPMVSDKGNGAPIDVNPKPKPSPLEKKLAKEIHRMVVVAETELMTVLRPDQRDGAIQQLLIAKQTVVDNVMLSVAKNSMNDELKYALKDAGLSTVDDLKALMEQSVRDKEDLEDVCNDVGCDRDSFKTTLGDIKAILQTLTIVLECDMGDLTDTVQDMCGENKRLKDELQMKQLLQDVDSSNALPPPPIQPALNGIGAQTSIGSAGGTSSEFAQLRARLNNSSLSQGVTPVLQTSLAAPPQSSTGLPCWQSTSQRGQTATRQGTNTNTSVNVGGQNQIGSETSVLLGMMRAQAMAPLEPFSGTTASAWVEYVRSFLLRFPRNVWPESDLISMLVERLRGVAREAFYSLPTTRDQLSLDELTNTIAQRLSKGGKSESLDAAARLRSLRKKEGQSVSSYCMELEKLSQLAYRDSSALTLSFIRAELLLNQLIAWDDSVALTSAMDESEDGEEYDRVKEAAMRLERNMELRESVRRANGPSIRTSEPQRSGNSGTARIEWKKREHARASTDTAPKPMNKMPMNAGRCFNCGLTGHIAKDCRRTRNGNGNGAAAQGEQARTPVIRPTGLVRTQPHTGSYSARVVKFIADCQEVQTVASSPKDSQNGLIGKRMEAEVTIFGIKTKALLDSGSQLSIVSSRILKKALEAGIDVDALIVEDIPLPEDEKIMDASGNIMKFNGALRTNVHLNANGKDSVVAMMVSPQREDVVLIGTNAFQDLNVQLVVNGVPETNDVPEGPSKQTKKRRRRRRKVTTLEVDEESRDTECSAVVCKRIFVAPGQTKDLPLGGAGGLGDMMFWSEHAAISAGIVHVDDQGIATVPVTNLSDKAVMLKEGDKVGTFGGEGWKSLSIEDAADMLDEHVQGAELCESSPERRELLIEKLSENRDRGDSFPERLRSLILEFEDVFALFDHELTTTDLVQHGIDTGDHAPIRQKCRPVPMGVKSQFKEILKGLLERGIVEPSSSDWASPVVLVEKKDKSIRVCIDYRALNKVVKQDCYPLPKIDQILQTLGSRRIFSTLDMHSGYWQIGLTDEAKEKSAFTTSEGLYQFKVLPFGLSTSPATFQRLMDKVLQGLKGDDVHVYIDDILICTETEDRHIEVMREVLLRMRKARLRLKASKCTLMVNRVPFLGHVVDAQGVHTDVNKVNSVRNFPVPETLASLRTFLGMAAYYRKFILKLASVAKPLYELTSPKTPWVWDDRRKEAFEMLKEKLCTAPVLAQPDVEGARDGSKPYIIYTDACTSGVGAVLCQEGRDKFLHPIYFASKSLTKAETRYSVTDLEGLAIVYALSKFHHFVYGMKLVVRTDHLPLTSVFKRTNTSNRLMRWALELQRYDVTIEYVKGTANAVADALSRGAAEAADIDIAGGNVKVVASTEICDKSQWLKELEEDDDYVCLIEAVRNGQDNWKLVKLETGQKSYTAADFALEEGYLCIWNEEGQLCKVVPKSKRRPLFEEMHAGRWAAHFGVKKVARKMKTSYFWPHLHRDIAKWHSECQKCFVNNHQGKMIPPLKPYQVSKPYEIVGVDILEIGQTISGNRYVLVVVDHFSKCLAAYPMVDKSAKSTAECLTKFWICEGARWPKTVLSDLGTEFMNQTMNELKSLTGIGWITTKGYNPRENGLTERANRTILDALRKKVNSPAEWDKLLPFVIYAYNTSVHEATGESPFFILHGFDPEPVSEIDEPKPPSLHLVVNEDYRAELIEGFRLARELVMNKLEKERDRMKKYYDEANAVEKCKYPQVGDRVYMRVPQEKAAHTHPKLVFDLKGPYRVVETSENSALITHLNGKEEPLRIQFDLLMVVPNQVEGVEMICKKGRGRKPKVKSIKVMAVRADANLFRFRSSQATVGVSQVKARKGSVEGPNRTSSARSTQTWGFICQRSQPITFQGSLQMVKCRLQDLSLGEILPGSPESVRDFRVTSLRTLLSMMSIASNDSLSPEECVRQMVDAEGIAAPTYNGLVGTFKVFRSYCRHAQGWNRDSPASLADKWSAETGIPAYLVKQAWSEASTGWDLESSYENFAFYRPKKMVVCVHDTWEILAEKFKFDAEIIVYKKIADLVPIIKGRTRTLIHLPPYRTAREEKLVDILLAMGKGVAAAGGDILLLPPICEASWYELLTLYDVAVGDVRRIQLAAGRRDPFEWLRPSESEAETQSVKLYPFILGAKPTQSTMDKLQLWQVVELLYGAEAWVKTKSHFKYPSFEVIEEAQEVTQPDENEERSEKSMARGADKKFGVSRGGVQKKNRGNPVAGYFARQGRGRGGSGRGFRGGWQRGGFGFGGQNSY